MTVRVKLTLLMAVLVGGTLAGLGYALHLRLHANLIDGVDRQLEAESSSMKIDRPSNLTSLGPAPKGGIVVQGSRSPHGTDAEQVVEVLGNRSSAIRLEVDPVVPRLIPLPSKGLPDLISRAEDPDGVRQAALSGRSFHNFTANGRPMRSLSILFKGEPKAVVQSVRSLVGVNQQMANLDQSLVMLVPLAIGLSGLLGAAFVGLAMRPVQRLADSAQRLAPDLSGPRLPVSGKDEFAQLARTFNGALDRTADAFERQRQAMAQLERFTGDAGHELRTPLAAIKGGVTYMLHGAELPKECADTAQSINRSADRMAKLIDDLLLLARQDAGSPLQCTEVDVGCLLEEAREELAEPPGVEVSLCAPPGLKVSADAEALRRVFVILWSNGFTYARSRLTVKASSVGGSVEVSFADDGEGIAPEHLERLGERFYRPDSARSRAQGGTGLGLAIAKSLCAAHGGSLGIVSEVGVGATVTVTLPKGPVGV